MTGLYVPLDAEYSSDPKIIRAGAMAELVYLRGLALTKRLLSDGYIDAAHLPQLALGIVGKPSKHAEALVREGLWAVERDGWVIVAWTRRNASRAEVEAKRQRKADAATKGNHERWHTDGKSSSDCRLCIAGAIAIGTPDDDVGNRVGSPKPEPYPKPKPYPSPEPPIASPHGFDNSDLHPADEARVEVVLAEYARTLQGRATVTIANPTAWRTTVIDKARTEHGDTIRRWLTDYDLSATRFAAGLIDGPARDWSHHRRQPA